MARKFTLLSFLFFLSVLVTSMSANAGTTYTNEGNPTSYNLYAGDSLKITRGTYTGSINTFNSGAVIIVNANATFHPGNLSNPMGQVIVYGVAKFSGISSNINFKVDNYGTFWVTGSVNMSGGVQQWTNYYGAAMKFDNGASMNSGAVITNKGTITSGGDISMNTGSAIANNNTINVIGSFTNNGGQLTNAGKLYATGSVTFNSGSTTVNTCRLIADGGFTNNSQSLSNYGLLWSTSKTSASTITNSGMMLNGPQATIKSVNFLNNSTLKGSGKLYFTGYTVNFGAVGTSGSTTDTLKIYDVSRTSTQTIFDLQYGSVQANAIYKASAAPDTINNLNACASELLSNVPLAVKWNYFYVNVSVNVPVLYWSAEQDMETRFELERSYDQNNFTTIATLSSKMSAMEYKYNDELVNIQATVVYYRVKAVEVSGLVKYSDTRMVKLISKNGISVQTAPNPFTSQFTVQYQAGQTGAVFLKLYSMGGQLQVEKNVQVSKGYNSINITEAASLTNGIYMMQVIEEGKIIASQKIIKQ